MAMKRVNPGSLVIKLLRSEVWCPVLLWGFRATELLELGLGV